MNGEVLIKDVDFTLLYEQRNELLNISGIRDSILYGVVMLMDEMLDEAEDNGLFEFPGEPYTVMTESQDRDLDEFFAAGAFLSSEKFDEENPFCYLWDDLGNDKIEQIWARFVSPQEDDDPLFVYTLIEKNKMGMIVEGYIPNKPIGFFFSNKSIEVPNGELRFF